MSGGSLNYKFNELHELASMINNQSECSLEKAFSAHLDKCAEAAKALEWYYSCDSGNEKAHKLIGEIITPTELKAVIKKELDQLSDDLKKLEDKIK